MEPIDEPLHFFQAFHKARKTLSPPQKESYATYQKRLGGSYNGVWLAYMQIWHDADLAIANAINELTRYNFDLKAWDAVTKPMDDDDKFNVALHFVDPLSALALNLPYVIQQRLLYAAAHLCHQANRAKLKGEWKDDLPNDAKINGKICDQYGAD
jgi:hypothetical protein